jgi:hypothetical protein
MEDLTLEQITELQKQYGADQIQNMINSGQCWHMEGSIGRMADSCLEWGICMLPEERHQDYYGSTVPSRNDVAPDTKGSFGNCLAFWTKVNDGDFETIDALESMFGKASEEDE